MLMSTLCVMKYSPIKASFKKGKSFQHSAYQTLLNYCAKQIYERSSVQKVRHKVSNNYCVHFQ